MSHDLHYSVSYFLNSGYFLKKTNVVGEENVVIRGGDASFLQTFGVMNNDDWRKPFLLALFCLWAIGSLGRAGGGFLLLSIMSGLLRGHYSVDALQSLIPPSTYFLFFVHDAIWACQTELKVEPDTFYSPFLPSTADLSSHSCTRNSN